MYTQEQIASRTMQSTDTLRNRAYSYIYSKLKRGELGPGDRLSNRKLAAEIGMSFIPIREAISDLASAGLVEHRPGQGSFVASCTRQDIRELYDLREALECHAVAKAAEVIDEERLTELRLINGELSETIEKLEAEGAPALTADLTDRWLTADARLHLLIFRIAGNRRALKTLRDLRVVTRIFGRRSSDRPIGKLRRTCEEHAAIIDALDAHDGDAARNVMAEHIRRGCERTLQVYDEQRMSEVEESSTALWETLGEMEEQQECAD